MSNPMRGQATQAVNAIHDYAKAATKLSSAIKSAEAAFGKKNQSKKQAALNTAEAAWLSQWQSTDQFVSAYTENYA